MIPFSPLSSDIDHRIRVVSYDLGNQDTCGFGNIASMPCALLVMILHVIHMSHVAFLIGDMTISRVFVIQHCLVFNHPECACFY